MKSCFFIIYRPGLLFDLLFFGGRVPPRQATFLLFVVRPWPSLLLMEMCSRCPWLQQFDMFFASDKSEFCLICAEPLLQILGAR